MKTTTTVELSSAPVSAPVPVPVPAPAAAAADGPVRVAVLVGSNRQGRFGPVVAEWLLGQVRERDDLVPDVVDVAEIPLPTTMSPSPAATAALAEVTPKLAAADAFVVLTPEYNHSFPAGLKNLIDWHYAEWRAKPVALVSYGGVSGVCAPSSTSVRSSRSSTR
ncbi:hypothetical protein SAV31267_034190 [Streptomyces avermitilis]|uniref:NADPH-dependent FMN reductase-like domain-containing protein n=1 Tax=Streptomyces avermitilis TaxID=33903 RepID=A0A4D4MQH5_STRAX|nr:hypothetical protein SAV31267_034190 [Streptomyces avermitilis]